MCRLICLQYVEEKLISATRNSYVLILLCQKL